MTITTGKLLDSFIKVLEQKKVFEDGIRKFNLIDRSKLGYGNEGKPDSESGLFISEDSIQQCATGDVALLKGESWEGNDGAGLVHRSPYKEGSYKRLYMTIDFLETYINIYKNSLTN